MTRTPPTYECNTCRDLRHIPREDKFVRCPDCYTRRFIQRELMVRSYPSAWSNLDPTLVVNMFGPTSVVGSCITELLSGQIRLVHAVGLPTERRQAFMGSLAYGFLDRGMGAQVLDSADLAIKHFTKDADRWVDIERRREAVLFTMGREVETRVGFYYLRTLLDRACNYRLPFVLFTDYELEIYAPRYPDLMPIVNAAQFDRLNMSLAN